MKSNVQPIAYLVTSIRGGVEESHYEVQEDMGLQEVLEHDTAAVLYARALEQRCAALEKRCRMLERIVRAARPAEAE